MRWIFAALAVAMLTACGEAVEESENRQLRPHVVSDTFETGVGVVVRSLAVESGANHLWVGTSHGVLEIDLESQSMLNSFTRDHGLANEYVFAIGIDSEGYKWFGTNAGGVSRYRDGDWKTFFPMHGLADYWIYAFAEQDPSAFWIGTWAGVNKVNLADLSFETYLKELINEWVYGIDIDSRGQVWFGTEGGVTRFDGSTWQHWTHADGLGAPNATNLPHSQNTGLGTRNRHDLSVSVQGGESYNPNYVFSVQVDENDQVWFGTWGGGVSRFDGSRWQTYTEADGLAGNIVYSIAQDSGGNYWFGTNRGLSRFDGEKWLTYGKEEGLPGEDVYALAAGVDGDIWAGSTGGVTRLTVQQ